jgi:anti-sigma factor RsiW
MTEPDEGLDCDELVELVTEFLEGALDGPTERRLVDHLALCDGCGTYLEQIRATARALGDLPPDRLPAPARTALLSAFRAGAGTDPGTDVNRSGDRPGNGLEVD